MEEQVQVEQQTTEIPQEEAPQVEQQAVEATDNSKDANFAALRNAKEETDRQNALLNERLRSYEQQQAKAAELKDDELVDGKQVKDYTRKIEQTLTDIRIKSEYPDFYTVVNEKSIEQFRIAYPELAATVASSKNQYQQAASLYTLINKFGAHDSKDHTKNQQNVQSNSSKPRPLTSMSPQQGDSPLAQANAFANGLTPELKKNLLREMMEARSRA